MPAEITAACLTAAIGLAAIIIAKSKCFCRNIDEDGCQYGVAFSDKAIIPDNGRYEKVDLNEDVIILKK
jgi:hypothetical protein